MENAVNPSNYYDYANTLELGDNNLENKLKTYAGRYHDIESIPSYVPGVVGENISEGSVEDVFIVLGLISIPVLVVLLIVIAIRRKKKIKARKHRGN